MVAAARANRNPRMELLRKIALGDDSIYCIREGSNRLQKALLDFLNERNRFPPSLQNLPELTQAVKIGYDPESDDSRRQGAITAIAKIIHPALYANPERISGIRLALERAVSEVFEGFRHYEDRNSNKPGRMANGDQYLVEHSFHSCFLITYRGKNDASRQTYPAIEVPFRDPIAAINHDYFEDVPEEHQLPLEELVKRIAGDLPGALQDEVMTGLRVAQRLRLRKGDDYFKGVSRINDRINDIPWSEERREIASAWRVKAVDKLSSVQMSEGFDYHKILKTIVGKTYKTINELRKWYYALSSNEQAEPQNKEAILLTIQLALGWALSMKHIVNVITEDLKLFPPEKFDPYRALSEQKRDVAAYICAKNLGHQDFSPTEQHRFLAGTIRFTKLLGMHLSTEGAYIDQRLMLEGESNEDARLRLLGEREGYKLQLPDLRIKDYLAALELDESLLTPRQRDLRRRFPTKEAGFKAYVELTRPFMVCRALARKYATNETFYFQEGF